MNGEIQVWKIDAAGEAEAQAALHRILERTIGRPPVIARMPQGKPFVENAPELKFNFSRTKGLALVAIATGPIEIGVDIERLRPMPDLQQIAEVFLPPGDAELLEEIPANARERAFFRLWTRAEALWKAAGLGLYGAGRIIEGDWHVRDLELGEGLAAAVASSIPPPSITISDFGADE
jgi:4'-phosphopantetheinyl transferase